MSISASLLSLKSENHTAISSTIYDNLADARNKSPTFIRKVGTSLAFAPLALLAAIETVVNAVLTAVFYALTRVLSNEDGSPLTNLEFAKLERGNIEQSMLTVFRSAKGIVANFTKEALPLVYAKA